MATYSGQVRRLVAYAAVGAAIITAEWRPRAAGTISGVVFEDFNGNGVLDTATTLANTSGTGATPAAVDRGRAGIVIRAYDSAGAPQGPTAVTDGTGAYALATSGTGPYRVEFTNLPPRYQPSAVAPGATGNGSTIQFVADGTVGGVNLAILDPANVCHDNPTLVTSCFLFADNVSGPFNTSPALVGFPYAAGSNSASDPGRYFDPQTHALMVPANRIGSVYGLAYRPATATVYAAAFMKKHTGFGPHGTGAVYAIDPNSGATTLFADLNVIFGAAAAGLDGHAGNGGDYARDNDDIAWDAVGKTALGGLEVAADGRTIFVVNLADRHVYAVPTSGPITTATVRRVSVPLDAPGATGVGGADLRPFALQAHRGQLYVGVVNSAESTQLASDLQAYVYRLDPVTLTFSATPVLQFALNYPRGNVQLVQPGGEAAWRPWSPTFVTTSPGPLLVAGIYPQPMLAGLSFDVDGNLTIGIRDRAGDQFGLYSLDEPGSGTLYEGMTGGDTLFAAADVPGNLGGGWTLEGNAQAGAFGPTAGANGSQGPGGGEYFFGDSFVSLAGQLVHQEVTTGALLQVPGFPDVVSSAFDAGLSVRTGGFVWLRQVDGTRTKGYDLYFSPGPPAAALGTFGKGNGLGEVVATCAAAPIEVGNRVWEDRDGDGVQDPNEPALDDVLVQLVAPNGTVLGAATTANGGQYYFSSAAAGPVPGGIYGISALTPNTAGFQVRIALAQPALGGRAPTVPNADASVNGDSRDSDGVLSGSDVAIPFATGGAGANTHTYDFGFVAATLSLGNLVWVDYNNDGRVSAGEPGIDGFAVRLYNGTRGTLLATQTTAGGGFYRFTGLPPGDYVVDVIRQSNYLYVDPSDGRIRRDVLSSTASGFELPAPPDPDNDQDDDDNGRDQGVDTVTGGLVTRSLPVTLAAGAEPVNDGDADPNSNLTVDFGFFGVTAPDEPNPCISLQVPAVATPGGTLNFRVGTINQGPEPSGTLVIDGMIPDGTTFLSAQPTAAGVCSLANGTLECAWPGPHPSGRQHWVDVSLRVNPSAPHGQTIPLWFMSNNGTIPGGACMFDANVFVVNGGPTADLVVTATATAGTSSGRTVAAVPHQPMQATVTVHNAGNTPAQGQYALLLDVAGTLDVTAASTTQGWVSGSGPQSGVFDTGLIAPGQAAVLSVTLVPRTAAVARVEVVRVTGSPADPDARSDRTDFVVDGIGGARSIALGNVFDSFTGGELLVGAGLGESPQVRVFNGIGEELTTPFYAFDRSFRGGVRLASCDVDANGLDEVVVAHGPGGGQVRVLSLVGGVQTQMAAFPAFEPGFTGGVNVACADLDADGRAEIVVGPDGGRAPDVRTFGISGSTATLRTQFQAYEPGFSGGVRVAAARVPASAIVGSFQVATTPGPGRPGDVRAWRVSGATAALVSQARVTSGDGATVALGDTDADGAFDLLVAPDAGSPRLLQVFSLATGALILDVPAGTGGFRSVRPALGALTSAQNVVQIVTVVGSGAGELPTVSAFVVTSSGLSSLRTMRTGEVP